MANSIDEACALVAPLMMGYVSTERTFAALMALVKGQLSRPMGVSSSRGSSSGSGIGLLDIAADCDLHVGESTYLLRHTAALGATLALMARAEWPLRTKVLRELHHQVRAIVENQEKLVQITGWQSLFLDLLPAVGESIDAGAGAGAGAGAEPNPNANSSANPMSVARAREVVTDIFAQCLFYSMANTRGGWELVDQTITRIYSAAERRQQRQLRAGIVAGPDDDDAATYAAGMVRALLLQLVAMIKAEGKTIPSPLWPAMTDNFVHFLLTCEEYLFYPRTGLEASVSASASAATASATAPRTPERATSKKSGSATNGAAAAAAVEDNDEEADGAVESPTTSLAVGDALRPRAASTATPEATATRSPSPGGAAAGRSSAGAGGGSTGIDAMATGRAYALSAASSVSSMSASPSASHMRTGPGGIDPVLGDTFECRPRLSAEGAWLDVDLALKLLEVLAHFQLARTPDFEALRYTPTTKARLRAGGPLRITLRLLSRCLLYARDLAGPAFLVCYLVTAREFEGDTDKVIYLLSYLFRSFEREVELWDHQDEEPRRDGSPGDGAPGDAMARVAFDPKAKANPAKAQGRASSGGDGAGTAAGGGDVPPRLLALTRLLRHILLKFRPSLASLLLSSSLHSLLASAPPQLLPPATPAESVRFLASNQWRRAADSHIHYPARAATLRDAHWASDVARDRRDVERECAEMDAEAASAAGAAGGGARDRYVRGRGVSFYIFVC
jgi:hypothetical protein